MTEATPASLSVFRPRVLYTAFHVGDLDRSAAFYIVVLGMQQRMRFQLPNGVWECVLEYPDSKGSGVILMWDPKREGKPAMGEAYSRLVLKVSDLDAAVDSLRNHDTKITVPPTDTPLGLRYAMFQDPDGYTIELMQPKEP